MHDYKERCFLIDNRSKSSEVPNIELDCSVVKMFDKPNSMDSIAREVTTFVQTIDSKDPEWKAKLLRFVESQVNKDVVPHHPQFLVGSEDELSDTSESPPATPTTPTPITDVTHNSPAVENSSLMTKIRNSMPLEALYNIWTNKAEDASGLSDSDINRLMKEGLAKMRELEPKVGDLDRAIRIRRNFLNTDLSNFPYENFDYNFVVGSCCENVIGYTPIPTGVAGPLRMNSQDYYVPMATTEGALIASTSRGMSAIRSSGGVSARVFDDGMTRAPVVRFDSIVEAVKLKEWLEDCENFCVIKGKFQEMSRFATLKRLDLTLSGNFVYIRFVATTGDAMGMNMLTKCTDHAMIWLKEQFPDMQIISLSGNWCVDKKAAALNWINGRGKSVVAECRLPSSVVQSVLGTTPRALEIAARCKLEAGSDRAGTIGGQNAHAANVVAAMFLATGQDAAQVVSSSMCSTKIEVIEDDYLYITCTMPCLEVGTVGGGTILPAQNTLLKLLRCAGPSPVTPGDNAKCLAQLICATVLAAELSLMASLVKGDLVSSHMTLNRSKLDLYGDAAKASTSNKQSEPGATLEKSAAEPQQGTSELKRSKRKSESNRPFECSNIL